MKNKKIWNVYLVLIISSISFMELQMISNADNLYDLDINYIKINSEDRYYYSESKQSPGDMLTVYKKGDIIDVNYENKKIEDIRVYSNDDEIGREIVFMFNGVNNDNQFEMPAADVTIEYIISDSDE